MKIFCGYQPVEGPWGGANNFLRCLYRELRDAHGCSISFSSDDPADILFLNQLGRGPGGQKGQRTQEDIAALRARHPNAPLIMRAVSLGKYTSNMPPWRYFFSEGRRKDRRVLQAMETVDGVIFQSAYQKSLFAAEMREPAQSVIIHNGAQPDFLGANYQAPPLSDNERLRIFSSSFSARAIKRMDIIARLSRVPGVEIIHAGRWPDNLPKEKVQCAGILDHDQMIAHMRGCHYFLHPAIRDACPNSMIEAMSMGLPVMYNPGPGSGAELGTTHGIALIESDPAATISTARDQYAALSTALVTAREEYSITFAARAYLDFFTAKAKHHARRA